MLQLAFIRQNRDLVKERLAVKNFTDLNTVDEIIELDEQRRKKQLENDDLAAKVNAASKEIGKLMGKGEKETAEQKKTEVTQYKESSKQIAEELSLLEQQVNELLVRLPNLPSALVPVGKTPEDNVHVKEAGNDPVLPANAVPHWELIKQYDIVNF